MKNLLAGLLIAGIGLGAALALSSSIVSASPGQNNACTSCHALSNSLHISTDITSKTVAPGQSFPVSVSWSGAVNGSRTEVNWPSTQSNSLFNPNPRIPFSSSRNSASGTTSSTLTAPTAPGTYTVRVFVAHGSPRETNYADVVVLVTGATDGAPVLGPIGNKTVSVGQLLQFTVSATDPDGDPLTYSASNLPPGAGFDASTRKFSWTPSTAGTYSNVTFRVSDGSLADSETITIFVNNTNAAPRLNAIGNKTIAVGQLLQFSVSAADPDGDRLTYSASNLPAGARFNASTRTFFWTPVKAATYSNVTFRVSDGSLTDSEVITIKVDGPPVLNPIGNRTVGIGQFLQFTISATDPNGGPLSYAASNLPPGARFDASTRTFSWTPAPGQAGFFTSVHFEVSDSVNTASEDITIIVSESGAVVPGAVPSGNVPPVIDPVGDKLVNAGQILQFMVSADDANYDVLSYSASNLPPGADFNRTTRTFTWRPTEEQAGVYRDVVFKVSDGVLTASMSITVTVSEPDRTGPEIKSVEIAETTPGGAVIHWTTDEPSTSQVEYWASPGQLSPLESDLVTEHTVRLTGLKPGTTYGYRTLSADRAGNLSRSTAQEFTTLPAFSVSGLTINPAEAQVGEEVAINVLVTNNLEVAGSCELTLRVGGAREYVTTADLAAGERRLVSFTTTRYTAGSSVIDVNGATATLVVSGPGQGMSGGFPWVLTMGGVPLAGAGVAGWLIYRRRRLNWR